MDYEMLSKMSPTRRSLEIARDILLDGKEHTKKQVFQQMRKTLDSMGFTKDNLNHIQNGFYAAVKELDCKIGHGVYQYSSLDQVKEEKPVSKDIEHAEKAMHYCALIKKGINGLCQILDLGDDPFDEMSRLQTYKSMFGNADKWEKQYAEFIQDQDEAPVMEQTM